MTKPHPEFVNGKTVKTEIIELHQFFQNWFQGEIEEDISRFSQCLDNRFELITPSGRQLFKQGIIDSVAEGYNTQPNRKIWVEDITTKRIGNQVLATYFELQENDGKSNKRFSTSIFTFNNNLPNLATWVHVHETWVNQ